MCQSNVRNGGAKLPSDPSAGYGRDTARVDGQHQVLKGYEPTALFGKGKLLNSSDGCVGFAIR